MRNTHPALQVGDYHTLLADDARDLLAFSRSYEHQNMVVVVNNSSADQRAIVPALQNSVYDDLLEDNHRFASNGEQLEVDLKAKSGRILIRRA
ncbi:alpha-glucosidase C-terminal domain-containing protein [candidate division KSB1 bacterium]|nr:alpha-glucosidase C-terminal domain-containing protein [candidate division KSB1 bacterium]